MAGTAAAWSDWRTWRRLRADPTTLLLVAAFVGRERLLAAYQEAIRLGHRFYSFGDAMLIV